MAAFGTVLGVFTFTANSIVSSNVATLSSGSGVVQAGDMVFAWFVEQTSLTATAVSDNLGHTYTAANAGVDAGTVTGRPFYARMTANGTLTSLTGSATASADNVAFMGAAIVGPFDYPTTIAANPAMITSDTTSVFTTPATGVLTQATEAVIIYGCANYGTAWNATSGASLIVDLATQTVAKGAMGIFLSANTSSASAGFSAAGNPTNCILGIASF